MQRQCLDGWMKGGWMHRTQIEWMRYVRVCVC